MIFIILIHHPRRRRERRLLLLLLGGIVLLLLLLLLLHVSHGHCVVVSSHQVFSRSCLTHHGLVVACVH